MQLDLASFKSVRAFAAAFKKKGLPLHVLVNNAGVMQHARLLTEDGNEMTLQANYLGHWLLTNLLMPALKAANGGARIVNISSSMHWVRSPRCLPFSRTARLTAVRLQRTFGRRFGVGHRSNAGHAVPLLTDTRTHTHADLPRRAQGEKRFDFEDIQGERGYAMFRAYEQSKLAQLLSTMELDRQLAGSSVTVNAVHPGSVVTNVTSGFHPVIRFLEGLTTPLQYAMRKPRDAGAYTAIHCAVSPEVQGVSGKYFWHCREEYRSPLVDDRETQRKLWEVTEKLVGKSAAQ